ncbi:MAG: MqnA/MqnD/SBP family protein, partial [Planctomycetota bacterium]|nr:MqnA/MqnD/SBP family protein [Planctomycetota bacterium]
AGAGAEEIGRWLSGRSLAVPGLDTTAYLVLRLAVGAAPAGRVVPTVFHDVPGMVARGEADAGLLIHDAQLTYGTYGLREMLDLGGWWLEETGLPLPLGGNAVRRDLDERFGTGSVEEVGELLSRSVRHAVGHREEGLRRIAPMTVGIERATLERYLDMYVSGLTVSAGRAGRASIEALLRRGYEAGLGPDPGVIDMVGGDD